MVQNDLLKSSFDQEEDTSFIDKSDVTVIIPVLNEENAIGIVINNIKNSGYEKILVVDGNSIDNTYNIVKNHNVKIMRQNGRGKTGAIKTAIENVLTPYIAIMDGDNTYDPNEIEFLLPYLHNHHEVIGARVLSRTNIPKLNRLGNWLINKIFNLLFNTKISDVCSGMYVLRTDFAKEMIFETQGFDVEVEIASQAVRFGELKEVPINYYERIGIQKLQPFKDGFIILSSIFKLAMKYNPVIIFSTIGTVIIIPAFVMLINLLFNNIPNNNEIFSYLIILFLLMFGMFSFTVGIMALLFKRMEYRIYRANIK